MKLLFLFSREQTEGWAEGRKRFDVLFTNASPGLSQAKADRPVQSQVSGHRFY